METNYGGKFGTESKMNQTSLDVELPRKGG